MKIYNHKDLNCGFVILCTEHAVNLLKSTVNSIKSRYPGIPMICAVDNTATTDDLKDMKSFCPTYKGKNTFSSLINVGMRHAPAEWNFIVMAGVTVRWKMDQKFSFFIENEKDILFPIVDGKTNFVDATLNGLFINKKTWYEVGEMDEKGEFEYIKANWGYRAIKNGTTFKAIAGSRMC